MKLRKILFWSATVLIAQLALAKMPMTNDMFGKVEGTLDYCARIDPSSAARYAQKKKSLVKDVPENEVADARKTQEYKIAYEGITADLPKMPKDQVNNACSAAREANN